MSRLVLVTGSNGFVGATLCKKMLSEGWQVRGMVRKTSDLSLLEGVPIQMAFGSLEDARSLEKAVQGADLVVHAAAAVTDWGTYSYFRQTNVEGTRNVLEAAIHSGVKRFVHVSTVAVHNFLGCRNMNEESPQLPTPFPYCQTKREAESLVLEAGLQNRIETVVVRPGDVYGPGDHVALVKMADMLESGTMVLLGKGRSLGAFTYVENLVEGIFLAGTRDRAAGETYVITDGIKLSWKEYFDKLTDALDVPRPRFSISPALAWGVASALEGIWKVFRIRSRPLVSRYLVDHLRKDFHFSIDKAARELGYVPSVGVDEAIRRTALWYRKVVRGERGDGS